MYRSRKDGLALKSPTRKPLSVEELVLAVMKMPQVTESNTCCVKKGEC